LLLLRLLCTLLLLLLVRLLCAFLLLLLLWLLTLLLLLLRGLLGTLLLLWLRLLGTLLLLLRLLCTFLLLWLLCTFLLLWLLTLLLLRLLGGLLLPRLLRTLLRLPPSLLVSLFFVVLSVSRYDQSGKQADCRGAGYPRVFHVINSYREMIQARRVPTSHRISLAGSGLVLAVPLERMMRMSCMTHKKAPLETL
jgi:hypothetical protein